MSANLAASIHARLLNRAKESGEDFNQVLARFATERFLFRLSTLPARRGTRIPNELPMGLSNEFAADRAKAMQWKAFVNKNRLIAPDLIDVVAEIREWLNEPMALARQRKGMSDGN